MIKFKRQDKVFRPGIPCMFPVIVIGSMLLISYFLFLSSFAMAAEAIGKFTHVEGKVDILREGAFPAITVKMQDQVYPRDIVRTKSGSKAEIIFKDNTVLQIAQRSRIDISEYYTGDTSKSVIKLSRGQVKAVVDKNVTKRISLAPDANRFEIQTPNAVAGVRGTEFHVAYDRNVTTVLLKEGNVCVFNIKAQENVVCMPPSYIVTVTGVMIPQQPRKATDTEIKIFEKETAPNVPLSKTFPETATELLVADRGILPDGSNRPDRQPIPPEIIAMKETPTNITDIPVMIPFTDKFPLNPEPPLPHPGKFRSDFSTDIWSNYPQVRDGFFDGGLEGTTTLWTATQAMPAAARIAGVYSANSSLPHIWFENNVYSHNPPGSENTTSDGGAYRGFMGGRETNSAGNAMFTGLYIDPSGNIGFLRGNFTGTISGNALLMNGGLYPIQMGTDTISPGDFYNSIVTGFFAVSGAGSATASGIYNSMNITGHSDWGVSQMTLGGTYGDAMTNSWTLSLGGSYGAGYIFDADLTGSQWSSDRVSATAAGYWADARMSAPATGIYIGETTGTFNPADHTWQAVTDGVWLETNRFLQMVGDPSGRSKLQQMNIPAFEVGRTNLSGSLIAGSDSSLDYVSVMMDNVTFLAPSTGGKPGIWATNNVTGQYDFSNGHLTPVNIINTDNVIAISNGDGISADFQFTQWNTSTNTWTSSIRNGTGTLSGGSYNGPVNFRGAGAGTLTGTNSGSLSGTAAGIVK
jgi:hypothetical protein